MNDKKQIVKRDYNKILFNFSERFYQLRKSCKRPDGNKKSFKEISGEIYEFTNKSVTISHTQLAKYHKASLDPDDIMELNPSIKSVIAIADYYNVPLEYMLGLSDTKEYEDKYKIGSEAFGLSDVSMAILEDMKSRPHIFNVEGAENNVFKKFSGSDLINFLLDKLIYDLQDHFNRYFYELQRLEHINNIHENTDIDITDIRNSIIEKTKIEKELKDTKDLVNYRKYKISQLVERFVEELLQEVTEQENEKEID